MRGAALILTFSLAMVASGWTQKKGAPFTFQGQVFEMSLTDSTEKPAMGIPIEVWHEDQLITTLESGAKGKYKINLSLYPSYSIKFGKSPYITKIIEINAKGFERAAEFGMVNLQLDVSIFKEGNMMGLGFMNYTAFATAQFNKKKGTMEWDFDYADRMAKRVQGILDANKYPTTRSDK